MRTLLEQTKIALRQQAKNPAIEDEIESILASGIADLFYTAGVDVGHITDPRVSLDGKDIDQYDMLVVNALKTYAKLHFGEPDDPDRLSRSYDMQKAQLKSATYGRTV